MPAASKIQVICSALRRKQRCQILGGRCSSVVSISVAGARLSNLQIESHAFSID